MTDKLKEYEMEMETKLNQHKEVLHSLKERNKLLKSELQKEEKEQLNLIAKLKTKEEDRQRNIYLIGKEHTKKSIKERVKEKIPFMNKTDGYLLYINKSDILKIIPVSNMTYFIKLMNKKKEMYVLNDKICVFNNKPAFLIKYPYTISLNIQQDMNDTFSENHLFYDTHAFYNYHTMLEKQNMIKTGEGQSLTEFIKSNKKLIIIAILIIILLFTPQGKEFLAQLLNELSPR